MKITKPVGQVEAVMSAPTVPRRTGEEVANQTQVNLDAFKNGDAPLEEDFVRIPFGSAIMQLNATEIPGYHLHWLNDWHPSMADRIRQSQKAGYKFVTQQEVESSQLLGASTSDLSGDRVSRVVGTRPSGEPITAYLMKIPTAWWMEHQQAGLDHANKVDAAIRRGASGAKVEGGYNPTSDPIKLTAKLQQGDGE